MKKKKSFEFKTSIWSQIDFCSESYCPLHPPQMILTDINLYKFYLIKLLRTYDVGLGWFHIKTIVCMSRCHITTDNSTSSFKASMVILQCANALQAEEAWVFEIAWRSLYWKLPTVSWEFGQNNSGGWNLSVCKTICNKSRRLHSLIFKNI